MSPVPEYIPKIVTYPNSILTERCAEVLDFQDPLLSRLIDGMKFVVEREKAYGMAANQVWESLQILVYRDASTGLQALINPRITDFSDATELGKEGCLSMPGVQVSIRRHTEIVVEAVTPENKPITLFAIGMEARIIQHEVDHLEGKMIFDRLGKVERMMLLDKYRKAKLQNSRGTGQFGRFAKVA